MLIVLIRTLIIYFVLLIAVRLMGKGELSNMSPFQMIIMYMIAELAAIPIDDTSVSLLNGIVAIFTLVFIQVVISFASQKSEKFKSFIKGKPSLLINNGKLDVSKLKEMRITINDFVEQLRIEGTPSVSDIDYAILEANGQLSILPKSNKQPLTGNDMMIDEKNQSLPLLIICNGVLYEENLYLTGLKQEDVEIDINKKGIPSIKAVFMAFADENSELHFYTYDKNKIYAREVN